MKLISMAASLFLSGAILAGEVGKPNIILMMADDLGYGDTGFNGNTIIKTPNLDRMAEDGVKLTRFYAGGPVCSPTRATCLTGRHYYRMGIWTANQGHLPAQEITLARILKSKGYTTGHFGKWHLGTLSKTMSAKGARRKPAENYAPPWDRDYDRSFVVESAISTWNPGLGKRARNNPFYDDGKPVDPNDDSLKGGAGRVVVDRAVPFMEQAVKSGTPFLSVIWFNAPHEDIEAGPEYLKMYEGCGDAAHFYGCITEMDEQVGRIRENLEKWGVADNTLIFFCSDNGPEGSEPKGRRAGTTDGLRGRKRSLYDGGVHVPGFALWPRHIQPNTVVETPCSTLDYLPTVSKIVGYSMPDNRPIDGQDMMPIITGRMTHRDKAIPFRFNNGAAIVKDHYKLLLPQGELYDFNADWSEQHNMAAQYPERVARMKTELMDYLASMKKSHAGEDYHDPSFKPVGEHWKAYNPNAVPGQKKKKQKKGRKQKATGKK